MLEILSQLGSTLGGIAVIKNLLKNKKERKEKELAKDKLSKIEEVNPRLIEVEFVDHSDLQVSQRLNKLLYLLNQNRNHDEITISELAEFLNYDRTSDFKKYFSGSSEPTRQEKEEICNLLGVNPQWLKHGKGEPFVSQEKYQLYAFNYKNIIESKSPKEIIFVRSRSLEGRATILLRINKYKYIRLRKEWNISDKVGSTGQSQILSFCRLVEHLQEIKSNDFTCFFMQGIHVEEDVFNDLTCGRIYPGSIITSYNDTWWDDLTDIDHSWLGASSYEERYGKNFIDAQNIIKYLVRSKQSC